MYVCMYVCLCVYVCMFVCVCMYVCMYVWSHIQNPICSALWIDYRKHAGRSASRSDIGRYTSITTQCRYRENNSTRVAVRVPSE